MSDETDTYDAAADSLGSWEEWVRYKRAQWLAEHTERREEEGYDVQHDN